MVYIFWLLFLFPLLLSVNKRSTLAKIWGDCSPPSPQPSVSTGLNMYCYLILKLKFLRKTDFSEYQEMAAPTFLFIKENYAFTHQNLNPSLLINKTIVKKRKETVSFRFLTRNYRTEKSYKYGQKVVDKFTKLSKIGFSMGCFAADFLWLASENFKN